MDELGNFMQPQPMAPAAQPDPGLKAEWDGWLQNPKNRAAMLSFGLGLMTPTWGNSFANAAGAAAESYGAVEKQQQDEAIRQEGVARSQADKEAERNLRRELNTADNDAAIARTVAAKGTGAENKAQARWDRAYYYMQTKLARDNKAAQEYNDDILNVDNPKRAVLSDEEILQQAETFADQTAGKGPGHGAAGADAGTGNSQIPAQNAAEGEGAAPATSPPAAAPGATNNSTNEPTGVSASDFVNKVDPGKLDQLLANPKADEYLKQFNLNTAMVRQAKAQRDARNWLLQLGVGGPPGVATPMTRGPGTGQVK